MFQSALFQTISAVICTSDLVLAVDPCWLPHEVAEIRDYVYGRLNGRPLYVLFTHSDYDHIIGYRAFSGAIIVAGAAFAAKSEADKDDILEQIRSFDDEYYVSRDYAIDYPEVDRVAGGDGDALAVGETRLTFYNAPGHNPDGIFTVVEPLGVLLAGDYFSEVEFPYIDDSSSLYESSLAKLDVMLERHPVTLLVSGHGLPAEDHAEMRKRQQDSYRYIHAMRRAVAEGDDDSAARLIDGCRFPRVMRKFHENNKRLFARELGLAGDMPSV